MSENILNINNREEFRNWLMKNASCEKECYIIVQKGKPTDSNAFYYIDAVEEALCFGWIDSTYDIINGIHMQRFAKRRKNSNWTELNKERVRRLEKLGLMTDLGRKVLPKMGSRSFKIDKDIADALKKARVWSKFKSFPQLYQRIRASNLAFYKKRDFKIYENMLNHLILTTKNGEMFGQWNDYGRLLNY